MCALTQLIDLGKYITQQDCTKSEGTRNVGRPKWADNVISDSPSISAFDPIHQRCMYVYYIRNESTCVMGVNMVGLL